MAAVPSDATLLCSELNKVGRPHRRSGADPHDVRRGAALTEQRGGVGSAAAGAVPGGRAGGRVRQGTPRRLHPQRTEAQA